MFESFLLENISTSAFSFIWTTIPFSRTEKLIPQYIISSTFLIEYDERVGTDIYVDCKDEQTKLDIISEIIRKHPKIKISKSELGVGACWGFNIYISIIEDERGENNE